MMQLGLYRRRCVVYIGCDVQFLTRGEVRGPVFTNVPRACRRKSAFEWAPGVRRWNRAHDSGAFWALLKSGRWVLTLPEYVEQDQRLNTDLGAADWSAPQDCMCEPPVLARTGLTVRQHQLLTLSRYRRLRDLAPAGNWIPVLQGWELDDYRRHIDDYQDFLGVDLRDAPLVGVGSTCRRQGLKSGGAIYRMVHDRGIRAHYFGASLAAAQAGYLEMAESADSQAWSFSAKKESKRAGGDPGWAANSIEVAEIYRDRMNYGIDGNKEGMADALERWRHAMTLQHPKNRAA